MSRLYRFALPLIAAACLGCAQVSSEVPPGSTPLAQAVAEQRPDLVAQLLSAGASPDSADERGTAAIIIAAATDQFAVATMLAEAGADVFAADQLGYTPAIYARTSHVADDSAEGEARRAFIDILRARGHPWPPPFPDEVVALRAAGQWPPRR